MERNRYTIGIDFGTQSGRAVLVDIGTGEEVASSVKEYPDGVIDEYLPGTDIRLESDWALQNPDDYIDVLVTTVSKVIHDSQVDPQDVIGLSIDFTSCTVVPVASDGRALSQLEQYKHHPHAWVKLWKHHAAQDEANQLNEMAKERTERFLERYGNKVSSEWMIPKIWEVVNDEPELYRDIDQFMEATDWVTMQLTGVAVRNSCTAGYKAMWHKQEGFPDNEFFKALDPSLEHVVEEKLRSPIQPIGSKAGELTEKMARKLGLIPGTAVAVGNVDAHVAVPAVNVTKPEKMVMVMGTSICHLVLGETEQMIEGMCGVVEDGIIPGLFGYEAGQAAVGDIFEWFITSSVPEHYFEEANQRNLNIHQLLEEKACKLMPGESGLLTLDWWNGNRSVIVDADLSGIILGLNLQTKAEEIYRALIEATAFGTKKIIDEFRNNGVDIHELYACGGLPQKNKLFMQIYADITNMEIRISASTQTPALGSAMFAAVAAGEERGGYSSIVEAAKYMAKLQDKVYRPIKRNITIYEQLYREYCKLHDYFGRGENEVMKTLKRIKRGGGENDA
ncbi:ribulokinase [Robertmurraya massiliosenegalensis]|uniref:ribulokinase n=1 Tax=Robertmurraya TaxID=2837507 RepID=UPI0039A50A6D